jgi:signal transduction histidine kinase
LSCGPAKSGTVFSVWGRLIRDRRFLAFALPAIVGIIAALVLVSSDLVVYLEGAISVVVLIAGVVVGILAAAVVVLVGRRANRPNVTADPVPPVRSNERLAMLSNLYDAITARLLTIDATLTESVSDEAAVAAVRREISRLEQFLFDVHGVASLHDVKPNLEDIDPGELVESVIEQTSRAAGERPLKADIPSEPGVIQADRKLLSLALINLVVNSVKFSTPETPIVVRAVDRGDRVLFQVEDQGPGVEDGDEIWGELARGSNAAAVPGAGLGLPLVRLVAEAHGGTAHLDSGRTATVATVEIPRR